MLVDIEAPPSSAEKISVAGFDPNFLVVVCWYLWPLSYRLPNMTATSLNTGSSIDIQLKQPMFVVFGLSCPLKSNFVDLQIEP